MQCIILAGGLGTRMARFTSTLPKALIPVNGVPFLRLKLQSLADEGVTNVVICTGHLGEQIELEVARHTPPGMVVRCLDDGPGLLGTGGAVRRAVDSIDIEGQFLLTYGDSYLTCDHERVFAAFDPTRFDGLMTLWRTGHDDANPNAVLEDGRVTAYDKVHVTSDMLWVDYGLLVLTRDAVTELIPPGVVCDLGDLCGRLADAGRLQGLEVPEKYFEIGSETGLTELEAHLARKDPR